MTYEGNRREKLNRNNESNQGMERCVNSKAVLRIIRELILTRCDGLLLVSQLVTFMIGWERSRKVVVMSEVILG